MTKEEAIQVLESMKSEESYNALIDLCDMAIEALKAEQKYVHIETYRDLYEKYIELKHKSADAVQGEWKIDEYGIYHCPFCHAINNTVYKSFCPNCGARMGVEE